MTKEDALMVFDRLDEAEVDVRLRARTVEYTNDPGTWVREYSVEVEAKALGEPELLHLVADQASKYEAAIEGDFAALVLR
jgi:nicotinamide mononucleotide adenylyltransferase